MPKLTVIVTCFNERPTIARAVEEAKNLAIDKEIIIVDNGSTDGSREILMSLNDGSLKIVFQPKNLGFGQSVKTGAAMAGGEFIYIQYADLEYDIECAYRMLTLAEEKGLDAVFGSRLYNNKKDIFSLIRERPYYLGTLITTFMINLFYGKKFTDIIGTRLYRTSSFRKLNIESNGMAFDFEVVGKVCKSGFRVEEVPVLYKPRSVWEGKKITPAHIIPAIFVILKNKFLTPRHPSTYAK